MLMLGKWNSNVVKRVFRYLHGIMDYAIYYQGKLETDRKIGIHGFVELQLGW